MVLTLRDLAKWLVVAVTVTVCAPDTVAGAV
jgi:hypothetical protein